MHRPLFCCWIVSLASAAWMILGCGGSDFQPVNSHLLESITVSPAAADAHDYPGGKVPFVATGHYNSAPATVTPLQANWAAVSEQLVNGTLTFGPVTRDVSVDQTGVAQCAAGASGTYAVIAWDLQDPTSKVSCASVSDFGEPGCNAVQATAQLTCP
jgi:hypothetical protein